MKEQQTVDKTTLDEIWDRNLNAYAFVLFANCEARFTGSRDGEWHEVTVSVEGEDRNLRFQFDQAYYDPKALSEILHHWDMWRDEAGLAPDSVIPLTINPEVKKITIGLLLRAGLDFYERARFLLDSTSPVHQDMRLQRALESIISGIEPRQTL